MNWNLITQTLINLATSFAAGYGTAILSGATPKMAMASGLVALGANGAGLYQLRK